MNQNFDCRPIEALGLEPEIVIKLKNVFIYTVGDLHLKTEDALKQIDGMNSELIKRIANKLLSYTGRSLSESIEEKDLIQLGKVSRRVYRLLMRSGILRISELMRLGENELQLIDGISIKGREEIEGFLKAYYGEKYYSIRQERIKDNPNTLGLGHLNFQEDILRTFRRGGVYTIGDVQKMSDSELLKINGVAEVRVINLKKEFKRVKIPRYDPGFNRIQKLNLPPSIQELVGKIGVDTISKLGNASIQELLEIPQIGPESIRTIILKYLIERFEEEGMVEITELSLIDMVEIVMEKIREETEYEKRRLKEILEELKMQRGIDTGVPYVEVPG